MNGPRIRLAKTTKEKVTTDTGWSVEKREDEFRDTVDLIIRTPHRKLKFKISLTKREWRKLTK